MTDRIKLTCLSFRIFFFIILSSFSLSVSCFVKCFTPSLSHTPTHSLACVHAHTQTDLQCARLLSLFEHQQLSWCDKVTKIQGWGLFFFRHGHNPTAVKVYTQQWYTASEDPMFVIIPTVTRAQMKANDTN